MFDCYDFRQSKPYLATLVVNLECPNYDVDKYDWTQTLEVFATENKFSEKNKMECSELVTNLVNLLDCLEKRHIQSISARYCVETFESHKGADAIDLGVEHCKEKWYLLVVNRYGHNKL